MGAARMAVTMGLAAMVAAACDRGAVPSAASDAATAVAGDAAAAVRDAAPVDPLARPWMLPTVSEDDPAIQKTMKLHAAELRATCGADGGRATVRVRLGSNGKVLKATTADGEKAVGDCYARGIERVAPFFPPKGEEYEALVHVP